MQTIKKLFLVPLLLFIVFSFSGCLGIPMPGESGSSNLSKSPDRNDSQGVFKTTDGGKTWQHKVTIEGSETALDQITIGAMAIDGDNPQILYLGTRGDGMYKSDNGGDSWHKLSDQNGKLRATSSIYDLAVESGNSNIIYAAALNDNRGVLLKSEDGGASWSEAYISTELDKQINRVQIDPVHKNIVYIGTEQGGFIKSQDRGNSWAEIGWFQSGVRDFVIDYHNTNGIVILTHNTLLKTVDGGADKDKSWANLKEDIEDQLDLDEGGFPSITSLTIDNTDPLIIYMTYKNLVYVSRDGGDHWTILPTITPTLTSSEDTPIIMKVGITNGIMYYGASNAIYKSSNKGQTWSSFDLPIDGSVRYTASDPRDPNVIYVGSYASKK